MRFCKPAPMVSSIALAGFVLQGVLALRMPAAPLCCLLPRQAANWRASSWQRLPWQAPLHGCAVYAAQASLALCSCWVVPAKNFTVQVHDNAVEAKQA